MSGIFEHNYDAVLHLLKVEHYPVAGADTAEQYLDYFFRNFPIVGWNYNPKYHTVHVWGNKWPVEVVVRELDNITKEVERLS